MLAETSYGYASFAPNGCRARPVLWPWKGCRNKSQQLQAVAYCHRGESKMEIPVYKERFHTFSIVCSLSACLLVFCLIAFLMTYSAPISDDYCRGAIGWKNAILEANSEYMHWTGRWCSVATEVFSFSFFNLYHSVPLILATAFLLRTAVTIYFFRAIFKVSYANAAIISMFLLSAWISISPGISQTVFWATGAIEDSISISFAILAIALMAKSRWIAAVPFITLASMMHELAAVVVFASCLSLLWMRRRNMKDYWPLFLMIFLSAFLVGFVGLAPGNSVRAGTISNHPQIISFIFSHSTLNNFAYVVHSSITWTVAPATLGLILFACGIRGGDAPPQSSDLIGWPLAVLILMMCLSVIFTILGYRVERVLDILAYILIVFLVSASIWLGAHLKTSRDLQMASLLIFALGTFASSNVEIMAKSVIDAPTYQRSMRDRAQTGRFERVKWPASYAWIDVGPDPNNWLNQCVARYLHVPSVTCPKCDFSAPSPESAKSAGSTGAGCEAETAKAPLE